MNHPKTCPRCLGKGRILVNTGNGRTETCPRCRILKSEKINGHPVVKE